MPAKNIIIGQNIDPAKAARARELRRTMTEGEKVLWERLRGNRLCGWHFRRQQVIGGFIVDFYCHAAGLAVELDGPVHENQADYDMERDRVLATYGVRVLRVKNQKVFENIEMVLGMILAACVDLTSHNPSMNGKHEY
jgi:very-short-patch-repair endonuclease